VHKYKLLVRTTLVAVLFGAAGLAFSQTAPVTTAATVTGAVPGTINVPVTVTSFNNIAAISLALDYSYSVLHFVQGTPNPVFPGFGAGEIDMGNGIHRINMGWYGSGTSLANGSTIMTIQFTYIDGSSALTWFDNGPSCEYVNGSGQILTDTPTANYYINGSVCGNIPSPGTITGPGSVCQGLQGAGYSVASVPQAIGYQWSVPPGAIVAGGSGTNSITVNYGVTASSGNVTVFCITTCGNGPSSSLPVTVNPLPVANAGNDVSIPYGTNTILHAASGGTGTFTYHWSPENLLVNPDAQNPQTVNLTATTVFTLLVTNVATQCQNTDQVVVSITGGPLSVNPTAVPDTVCRGGSVQLYANAGGGSGTYTYTWTSDPPGSPPWSSNLPNPVVTPDSSRTYHLSVFDGYNTVASGVFVLVYQLPTATIAGGDSLCDDGSTTVLTVTLTGSPPWSFIYSDGVNTTSVSGLYSPVFNIVTSVAGTYTVLWMNDAHCDGTTYGSATVLVFPVPPTPVISQDWNTLSSSLCCGNQWYKNDSLIPGATGQDYYATADGNYFDIVTENGCSSDTSNVINFVYNGIKEAAHPAFALFPVPAHDEVLLTPDDKCGRMLRVDICSMNGRSLKSIEVTEKGNQPVLLNIRDLPSGIYFVLVNFQSVIAVQKLVIY
jgi:hypothetical protein